MYQKITLIGNLVRDPEMRFLDNGVQVCDFSIATNRKWTGADGQSKEEVCYWRCTAWRKLAEVINQYMSKGRQVFIEGRMNPSEGNPRVYTKNDGSTGASYEMTVETIKFLGSGNGNGNGNGTPTVTEEQPF